MEDKIMKSRVEKFMTIPTKDHLRQCEQFHVHLRKKRFIERSNAKRGIKKFIDNFRNDIEYEFELVDPKQLISSQEAHRNPLFVKYKVYEKDIQDFREEAFGVNKDAKIGNFDHLISVLKSLIDTLEHDFNQEEIMEKTLDKDYGLLTRMYLFFLAGSDYFDISTLGSQLPELLRLIPLLHSFPEHLCLLLKMLICVSTIENISADFLYTKYGFVESIKEVFADMTDSEVCLSVHWILANLCIDSKDTRDQLLEACFLDHIVYLLNSKEIKMNELTLRNLAWCISCYLGKKLTLPSQITYFEPLLEPLNLLLYSKDDPTVEYALKIYYKLSEAMKCESELWHKLLSNDTVLKILNIALACDSSLKIALKVLCNCIQSQDLLDYLIKHDFTELIQDLQNRSDVKADDEILFLLQNLSLSSLDTICKLFSDGCFACLQRFLEEGNTVYQVRALKILCNLFKMGDFQLLEEMVAEGYVKSIVVGVLNNHSHQEALFWALSAIYAFLERDNHEQDFAQYLQECGGTQCIEDLQNDAINNDIYNKSVEIIRKFYDGEDEENDHCEMNVDQPRRTTEGRCSM